MRELTFFCSRPMTYDCDLSVLAMPKFGFPDGNHICTRTVIDINQQHAEICNFYVYVQLHYQKSNKRRADKWDLYYTYLCKDGSKYT